MIEVGSIVFGVFSTPNVNLKDHYSIVVESQMINGVEQLTLVYTSSLKDDDKHIRWPFGREFHAHEMLMAGFKKASRFDASAVSIVPAERVRKVGTVPAKMVAEVFDYMQKAHVKGRLTWSHFSTKKEVKVTGVKTSAAFA